MWFHCSSLTAVLCLCSDQTISISMKTIRMNECNRSHKAPLSIRIYVIFPIASESTIRRRKVNEDADLTLTLRCLLWRSLRDHAQHKKEDFRVFVLVLLLCLTNDQWRVSSLRCSAAVSQQTINLSDWCRSECLRGSNHLSFTVPSRRSS